MLRRVLGLFDLTLLLVVAVVNLNLVPVVASAGVSVLSLWLLGFLLFFLPQAIAVMELSARYPGEGGIYCWSKAAFGGLHGFISGWCYWTNNIFYIPTLLIYLVGYSTFIGGEKMLALADNRLYMISVSLLLLWTIIGLNIIGLGVGKWVHNVGAMGTFITTAAIIGMAGVALGSRGMANPMSVPALLPTLNDWRTLSMLGVVCFAFVGLELGSVMGDEIKDPRRVVPRAVVIAGIGCVLLYALSTFALQATIPVGDIGVIQGLLQAIHRLATDAHLPQVVPLLALVLTLNIAGTTCAWLAGSARIPFVIGLDRYLPSAFGYTHRRYRTPYVALIVQGIASTVFILINSVGSTVRDLYLILLNTAVIIQLVPFLYMFAALIRLRKEEGGRGIEKADPFSANPPSAIREPPSKAGLFKRTWPCYLAGVFGFVVTALGILLAFIPSQNVQNIWNYEIKTLLGTATFIVPAVLLFRLSARNIKVAAPAPEPSGIVSD